MIIGKSTPGLKFGISGFYKIEAVDINSGKSRTLCDWFPNLITNNGLNRIALNGSLFLSSGGILGGVAVGSGSSAPAVSDSQLESQVSFTNNSTNDSKGVNSSERYFYCRKTWQFGLGQAAGNISEVGVGEASNSLFSRSLIVDSSGDPTTITILSNEYLSVTYELRISQPTQDFESTINGYDVVLRSAAVDSTASYAWSDRPMNVYTSNNVEGVSNDAMGDITTWPATTESTDSTTASYSVGSYTRSGTLFFDTGTANFPINTCAFTFGPGVFQFSVSPPINKQNTDELTLGFSVTWAREGELPS